MQENRELLFAQNLTWQHTMASGNVDSYLSSGQKTRPEKYAKVEWPGKFMNFKHNCCV